MKIVVTEYFWVCYIAVITYPLKFSSFKIE